MTDQYGERGPWHSGDEKPEYKGWYEMKGDFVDGKLVMRKWDGRIWLWKDIFRNGRLYAALVYETDKWRGLAKKP